ncbi:MAG: hypothetical protein PUJ80_01270 [Verrucomicrobiota bacterium]|nr:hypothetical protein [Verrucomicrobiota bacterium]
MCLLPKRDFGPSCGFRPVRCIRARPRGGLDERRDAAASMPETKFKVRKTANGLRCRSLVKRANGDGSVSYVATMGRGSMQMVIR